MSRGLLLVLLLPVIAGCASRYCERGEQVYMDAVEQAPLQSPEGLQVPQPDPNFAIPEATGEDAQYATTVTDAKGRVRSRCLDMPPTLPAVSAPEPASEPEQGAWTEVEAEPAAESPLEAESGPAEN